MKVSGIKIKCMEKEDSLGQMVDTMRVITVWIKNKVMELLFGQMENHIRVNGIRENRMEREHLLRKMVNKEKEFG